jgi:E3 Ubiquitin ligase
MFIVSPILALIAIVLFIIGRVMAGKAVLIAGTERTTAAALVAGAKAGATESGSLSKFVEVSGTVICDSPLEAELTGAKCIHYETKVIREYEESYLSRSSDGSSQTQTRRGTENVASNSRSCLFMLDDGSGKIEVDPAGAEFHLDTTMSRFEPGEGARSIGSFVLNAVLAGSGGRRTIGYRFEEKCFPVGRQGYVFGEVSGAGTTLRIGKGSGRGKRLIISLKSEQELVRSARSGAMWLTIIAGVAMAGAIATVILGVLKR